MNSQIQDIQIQGHSMFPAIQDQDQLKVEFFKEPQALEFFKPGEVCLIRSGGEWVVHRVVKSHGVNLIKGDWSMAFDNSDVAWGKVLSVNGKKNFRSDSHGISRLSVKLTSPSKLIRRWNRIKMILYVFYKRITRN